MILLTRLKQSLNLKLPSTHPNQVYISALRKGLLRSDEKILTEHVTTNLLLYLPNDEEKRAICGFRGDVNNLRLAEHFWLEVHVALVLGRY